MEAGLTRDGRTESKSARSLEAIVQVMQGEVHR